jgi:GSH-dependent disulfide-bond oxidoreductase
MPSRFAWQTVDFADHPHVKRWYLTIAERPAVKRGWDVLKEGRAIPLP